MKFLIEDDGKAIIKIDLPPLQGGMSHSDRGDNSQTEPQTPLAKEAQKQLDEYFAGKRKTFDLPLSPHGTDFQKKVWNALLKIPYGKTISYKDIDPNAPRAVGMACNKNPIIIVIPCHRVIGSNGKLTGYAGGLEFKEKLLTLEATQAY